MMYNLELEVDCVDDPLSLKKVALKILSNSGFELDATLFPCLDTFLWQRIQLLVVSGKKTIRDQSSHINLPQFVLLKLIGFEVFTIKSSRAFALMYIISCWILY